MCQAVIQRREGEVFDLELHYCHPPEPPRTYQIEHIGTHMRDLAEADKRAQAKYLQHECVKRFGCTLTWIERAPKPCTKTDEPSFFERALKHD